MPDKNLVSEEIVSGGTHFPRKFCPTVIHTLAYNVKYCLYVLDFTPFMPLYLKGRFYANLVIKYLMECFYATDISVNCIVIYSQDDSHKEKILRQLVNLCYNIGFSL